MSDAATMDAWISYARSGDPAHQGIGPWAPCDADRRPTMVFGTGASGRMDDPFAEERQALEGDHPKDDGGGAGPPGQ